MSSRQQDDYPSRRNDGYRAPPMQRKGDRDSRSHSGRHQRPTSRDQYRRSPSPPRRYASPHGNHDSRPARDESRGYNDNWRDRPRSPDARRRGYVDRDREGYQSPVYNGRSVSRSRSRSPQRRDRSPYFGGPPSREVIMEGIPLDISEEDVRHHFLAKSTLDL
ncbi:MAG: hypothetical protein LQ350_001393 [Teloschistes chrysophthalmus]|nr:MAG: hypothetical protein LQ350_001393 [Niorma chrysophthalma]